MLENLDEARKEKNITLNQLAKLLDYSRYQSISDKINGRTKFTFDEAMLIHEVFFPEYKIEYLFSQKEKQTT